MEFSVPLVQGTLVKRYKRFLADVDLGGGKVVTAHCANSGSMLNVKTPGAEVWLSPARNPDRKLKWTWELIRIGGVLVGINTQHPNRLVEEAVANGTIAELRGYQTVRREVKYGRNSRIDLLLEGGGLPACYVEVKNVTLRRDPGPDGLAEFPDAVTARGTKHLAELSEMVRQGHRGVMLYLVQRPDCTCFSIAADIDPTYGRAFGTARAAGVETLCYICRVSAQSIEVDAPLPLTL